jgi:hypothetical protein
MINDYCPSRLRPGGTSQRREERAPLVEAVAIAATHYRHLMARYTERQADLVTAGVALDELVTRTWEEFEAVSGAEARLFALVDALDEAGGLAVVPRGE